MFLGSEVLELSIQFNSINVKCSSEVVDNEMYVYISVSVLHILATSNRESVSPPGWLKLPTTLILVVTALWQHRHNCKFHEVWVTKHLSYLFIIRPGLDAVFKRFQISYWPCRNQWTIVFNNWIEWYDRNNNSSF